MARCDAGNWTMISIMLITALCGILVLGAFVLHYDTQLGQLDRQFAVALPARATAVAPVSVRLRRDDDDGRLMRVLRLLLRYTPNASGQVWFAVIALVIAGMEISLGALVLPLWLAVLGGSVTGILVVRGLFTRQQYQYADKL